VQVRERRLREKFFCDITPELKREFIQGGEVIMHSPALARHLPTSQRSPAERVTDGVPASDVVPGFEIPVRALFGEAENLDALRAVLAAG